GRAHAGARPRSQLHRGHPCRRIHRPRRRHRRFRSRDEGAQEDLLRRMDRARGRTGSARRPSAHLCQTRQRPPARGLREGGFEGRGILKRRLSMTAKRVRIGLVGAGFVARCHLYGYHAFPAVFPDAPALPVLELVCDANDVLAAQAAARYGFRRSTGDWRKLVADRQVDVVDICVPSNLHREIALAAIPAGKHLYAEKPVGLDAREAAEIAKAAAKAGIRHLTGYTYLRNPLIGLAKKLIDEGAIGRVVHFRGAHNEDYLADPQAPFIWRCDPAVAGRAGALGDLGSHIIAIARRLVGDISAVCGMARTVYPLRPEAPGATQMRAVGNDDEAQFLMIFANGAA